MDCPAAVFGMFHRRGRQLDKYDPGMSRWEGRCSTQTQGGSECILTNKSAAVYPFHAVYLRLIGLHVIAGNFTVWGLHQL